MLNIRSIFQKKPKAIQAVGHTLADIPILGATMGLAAIEVALTTISSVTGAVALATAKGAVACMNGRVRLASVGRTGFTRKLGFAIGSTRTMAAQLAEMRL